VGARALPAGQNLGARLLILRRRQRLGRRDAAGLSGLSPTTIAAIESGRDCQTAVVARLAEALGAVLRLGPAGATATSVWSRRSGRTPRPALSSRPTARPTSRFGNAAGGRRHEVAPDRPRPPVAPVRGRSAPTLTERMLPAGRVPT
jgi:DNA-binding XRE family transcriptional regulator